MKPIQTIALSLLSAAIIASCNNPSGSIAVETINSPKVIETAGVVPSAMSVTSTKSTISKGTADNISAAKNAGKAVFLIVTGTGVTETDKLIRLV